MVRTSTWNPGQRLLALYIFLSQRNNRAFSLKRLAEIFKCSRQTVLRLVEQLELLDGVKLEAWMEGGERYYRLCGERDYSAMSFDAGALETLILCRDLVARFLPRGMSEELDNLATSLAGGAKSIAGETAGMSWGRGRIDYGPFEDILQSLRNAMHQRRLCAVRYRSQLGSEAKTYVMAPLCFVAYREGLYLYARRYESDFTPCDGNPYTLAVQRMKNVKMLAREFVPPAALESPRYFGFTFNDPFQVKVRFTPEVATYICEREWSKGQRIRRHKSGHVTLTFTTSSRPEVTGWLLGFGAEAEVLSPADLVEEVKAAHAAALAQYEG